MYLTKEDAMSLLCSLSEAKKMKAAVKYRKRRAIGFASTGALLGSMVGGPPGIAVGSILGGLLGALVWSTKFKPVSHILKELPPPEQEKLCSHVMAKIGSLQWTDVDHLTKLVMEDEALQEQLLKLLEGYVTKELKTTVQYGA
ncbi:protein C19orf12 homolog [Myotis myotis]|uniref:Neurodegeneration with brain iron accumulation 4 n=1 Tax=Myotis myotis TaxID=51298 RepID=A0A7J7SA73_MYOMY|nr:protein C19orf12 homolog [Myotis myotis]XP_036159405.1 protein C19orf12 homolog [Myotis myotis]XP_036202774.1 protein C19orf12 homolog [Myotis myotis]KAF6285301.1 neurodegeneration with brain iron accumulation 4 [Myotis myotis]